MAISIWVCFFTVISDKIISPLQSVNPGGAEKVDWYAPTKTAFLITGEYTDDKVGQVVVVDYSKLLKGRYR